MRQQFAHGYGEFRHAMNSMELPKRLGSIIAALILALMVASLFAGCGGGGGGTGAPTSAANSTPSTPGISPAMVTGTASTGSPLSGMVTLRDSSAMHADTVSVIASDGSFAINVAGMTAPFLLKATGSVDGVSHTMFSFAAGAGTANINPLSTAAVAAAAGVDDPATVFDAPDAATVAKVQAAMPAAVSALQTKLMPLLTEFSAAGTNPVSDPFPADHTGLDGVFDNISVTLSQGTVTVTNTASGAVIFKAPVASVASGRFTERDDDLPRVGSRPAAPTGVTAVGGDAQITVTWNPVANATSYDLYYVQQSGRRGEESARSPNDEDGVRATRVRNVTSPFVLTGLLANTTYSLSVRALNNNLRGPASAAVTATTSATTPPPTVPAAPTGVSATGGTKQVTVSWTNVSGATSYNLYWSTTTGVTTASGTRISGVTSPSVVTGLSDATNYFFIVTAVNSAGESAASIQVAAMTLPATPPPSPPAAPTGVTASGGANQVTLTWPTVANATSYNVYWSTTTGVTTATGTKISGVSSPFVHTGRAASTAYFYVVTAVNSAGESAASAEATATTNPPSATAPPAPTGLAATGGTQQVTLTWNAAATATSYNLYWSTVSGVTTATGTKISGVTSPFVHTGLTDATTYFYIVTAVNAAGESAASAEASATTTAAAIDGAALYTQFCSGCHGALGASDKQGASASQITSGIANVSAMRTRFNPTTGTLIKLTPAQIAAISAALQ